MRVIIQINGSGELAKFRAIVGSDGFAAGRQLVQFTSLHDHTDTTEQVVFARVHKSLS